MIFLSGEKNHDLENGLCFSSTRILSFSFTIVTKCWGFGDVYDQKLYGWKETRPGHSTGTVGLVPFLDRESPQNSRSLQESYLLFVTIDPLGDEQSSDKFYPYWTDMGLGKVFRKERRSKIKLSSTFTTYGFFRDRTHLFWPFVLINLLLFFIVARFPKREGVAFAVM